MTNFEEFALNHKKHNHCVGCGACMLDPRTNPDLVISVWCLSCYHRIDAAMPVDAPRPWANGTVYNS